LEVESTIFNVQDLTLSRDKLSINGYFSFHF